MISTVSIPLDITKYPDDVTIEKSGDTLQVKADGVDTAQLKDDSLLRADFE